MKHLYLLFSFFICLQLSAQDFIGQWYLHSITIDGVQQENTYDYQSYIEFVENADTPNTYLYDGFATCNYYFTEEPTTIVSGNTLSLPEPGATLSVCPDIYYEVDYLSLFYYNHPNNAIFSYTISGAGDDETLILTNEENNFATYGRQPLSNDNLLGEWQLIYIEVDGDRQYSTVPNSVNYINFENESSFMGSVCTTSYLGQYQQNSDNSIILSDVFAQAGFCNYEYEGDVFLTPYLWDVLGPDDGIDIFQYEIMGTGNDETLQLTNSLGNVAFYGKQGLPENHLPGRWYLHEISENGTTYENVYNPEFNINLELVDQIAGGIKLTMTGVCNDYDGAYNLVDESSVSIAGGYHSGSAVTCGNTEARDYEILYEEVLNLVSIEDPNPSILNFEVTGTGENQMLILTNEENDYIVYGRQQLLSTNDPTFEHSNIRLLQNPVSNTLRLSNTKAIEATYAIYSMNGKQLLSSETLKNNSIDVSKLSSGLYFLKVVSTVSEKTIKFIKK